MLLLTWPSPLISLSWRSSSWLTLSLAHKVTTLFRFIASLKFFLSRILPSKRHKTFSLLFKQNCKWEICLVCFCLHWQKGWASAGDQNWTNRRASEACFNLRLQPTKNSRIGKSKASCCADPCERTTTQLQSSDRSTCRTHSSCEAHL